ncbi:MAG: DUF1467 family protein [Rickettsiales bacterium]|jgi:predicted secreted protein|nr:DUF1467 family protein [Rickettsiales bacterium]
MLVSYIVTTVCIWWIVFLMTLPIAIESNGKKGIEGSAPKKAHLKIKLLATTVITPILSYFFCTFMNAYLENLILLNTGG